MSIHLQDFADFALSLAAEARRVTLAGFAADTSVENKLDQGFDPVTDADRGAELVMRRLIGTRFPDHGIAGEEIPDVAGDSPWRWSLDPIDGTRAFICGLPSWSTLIGLLEQDRPVLGLIDIPRLDELYIGYEGMGQKITADGARPIRTSGCRSLGEARLSTTDPHLFKGEEAECFHRLRSQIRLARYGLDGYGYALVAAGKLDLIIESGLKPYDYLPLIPVIRAAGGVIGDWHGGEDFSPGSVIAAATPELYAEAVEAIR